MRKSQKNHDDLTPVDSDHIHSVGYSPLDRTMTVRFHNGYTYKVHGVEPHVHQNFMSARSKGEFYHAYFKDNYHVERIA